MKITETEIPDVKVIAIDKYDDARGSFSEEYHRMKYVEQGVDTVFFQDNQSISTHPGTVRGLHYQLPPFEQAKLVRVICGAIFDVAVDLRPSSPHFGKHVSVRLTAEESGQVYVPEGFAHGFCTLAPNTIVAYKVSNVYARSYEGGVFWNDEDLGIAWPISELEAILSEKDRQLPAWRWVVEKKIFQSKLENQS